jgi:hypothetical protein
MKIKLFLVIMIIAVFSISILGCVGCGDTGSFLNRNDGNDGNGTNADGREVSDEDDVDSLNGAEEQDSSSNDESGDAEESGFGGADGNEPLIVGIIENRILLDGSEISLDELEEFILLNIDSDFVWELHDVHQAVKTVYDDVIELFTKHGIIYREKQD